MSFELGQTVFCVKKITDMCCVGGYRFRFEYLKGKIERIRYHQNDEGCIKLSFIVLPECFGFYPSGLAPCPFECDNEDIKIFEFEQDADDYIQMVLRGDNDG